MKKTAIIFSSLTGNTKKVAQAIYESIEGERELISIEEIKHISLEKYEKIILGFWVDKGTMDSRSKKVLKQIKGKKIAFFGTLGADPDSDHGQKVYKRAVELCSKNNSFIGGFLSLGEVAPKLIEMMGKFPLNLIHPLTEERKLRLDAAKNHPDLEDLERAKEYFKNIQEEICV
ncbi:MAG: flavodoxin family protein [Fusobacteriaceae bacterium]